MYNDQKLMIIKYYYDRRRVLGRRNENRRGHSTTQTDVLDRVKKDLHIINTGEHNPSGNLRENPQRRSTNNDWEDDSVTSEGDEADRRSLTQDGEDEDKVEQRIQNQIRSIRRGNKQIPEELRMTKSDNKTNRQASVFGEHRGRTTERQYENSNVRHNGDELSRKPTVRSSRDADNYLLEDMVIEREFERNRIGEGRNNEVNREGITLINLELELKRLRKELNQERNIKEKNRVDLQKRNMEIESSKDMAISRSRREAANATKALEVALKEIKNKDEQLKRQAYDKLGKTSRPGTIAHNAQCTVHNTQCRHRTRNQEVRSLSEDSDRVTERPELVRKDQSYAAQTTRAEQLESRIRNRRHQEPVRTKNIPRQGAGGITNNPLSYHDLGRQVQMERNLLENQPDISRETLQRRHQIRRVTQDPVYNTEDTDESDNDETLISLGARRRVDPRTESQLVRLEAKSKELKAKIAFCYTSTIIEDQILSTYTDSEILDAQKMSSTMLKQAEKLQEINHATNETFIRTMKFLTRERRQQIEDLFQDAHTAYDKILETVKNVKGQMRSRSIVTHNMPAHIAKNIVMPQFDGENLPHIYFFKKEINLLLEKQNIAKSSRGIFIRGQIKGAAASILTTGLKNHSDPSDSIIYKILETHYGEDQYIIGLLTKEHAKTGIIPGDEKGWARVYRITTKHVALIRQMTALKEARTGEICPISGAYVTGLFYYLGQARQSILANLKGYFNLNHTGKYELLKTTYTELEMNSSKAQVANSNIQKTDVIDGFAGISGEQNAKGIQQELREAIEQIKQAGRPQYPNNGGLIIPPVVPNVVIRPPAITQYNQPMNGNQKPPVTQQRCYKCDHIGHVASNCTTDQSSYYCSRCGTKGDHITYKCNKIIQDPQQRMSAHSTYPNNIRLPLNQQNQSTQNREVRFSGAPSGEPTMSCSICETKATVDNIEVQLREHPRTGRGKPLREACPVLTELPTMQSRVDLLKKLGICLACVRYKIDDSIHNGNYCDFPFSGLLCTVPGCKIRYSLCVDHKSSNSSQLDYITKLYEKSGLNVSFMHTIETFKSEETGQPSILIADKPSKGRPNYGNIEDLLDSVDNGVQPMIEGLPHFILFRMQGLQNKPLTIAYDTCAAFSIFRRDVLGTSIAAVEIETSSKHFVRGIGGRQESALFCALIPLEEGNKHQLISCHSVEEITEIRTYDISQIIDFVTHNQKETSLTTEQRPINKSMISEIRSCFNFADLGETIRIDGLIGINDFLIAPRLILETKIGINFYSVPIKPFGGGSKICLGGSIPDVLRLPVDVNTQVMDFVLANTQLDGNLRYNLIGNPNQGQHQIRNEGRTTLADQFRHNNGRTEMKTKGDRHTPTMLEQDPDEGSTEVHQIGQMDEERIYMSDEEDFINRRDCIRKINQTHQSTIANIHGTISRHESQSRLDSEEQSLTSEWIIPAMVGESSNNIVTKEQNNIRDTDELQEGRKDNMEKTKLYQISSEEQESKNPKSIKGASDMNDDDEDRGIVNQDEKKNTIKSNFYKTFMDKDLIDFRCRKCLGCKTCKGTEKRANISIKDEMENVILEQSVTIDIETNKLVGCLPLPVNYEELLGDNREYCERRLRSSLKRLAKLGEKERTQLKQSVQKLIDRGFISNIRQLNDSETAVIKEAKCQYYIPTGIVFKESSLSTPARLVLDASAKTSTGYALNDLLPKGDINLNMTKLVQVWHLMKYGVQGDLSSFYNRIYLTPEHWHVQRFLWIPDLKHDGEVETYVIRTLIYGVKSSGTQCEFAIKKICQINPRLRSAMGIGSSKGGRYVDDLTNSFQTEEEMDLETKYTIETLGKYGLYLKSHSFATTGREPASEISKDGAVGVGSYKWWPKDDMFSCNTPTIFIGNRIRGSYANLRIFKGSTEEELFEFFPKDFTLRDMLSKVAGFYDAGIGIITPLVAELRGYIREGVLANQTEEGTTNWEAKIYETILRPICKIMAEIIEIGTYKFPRCQIKADLLHGKGILMTFVDSGDFETVLIYISFETQTGNSCSLVTSKSYLKRGEVTVPKSELNACSLGATISMQVQENLSEYISESYLFSDSSISIGWIGNSTRVLSPYHRNRVSCILDVYDRGNIYHVITSKNPADLISRKGIKAQTMRPDSPFYNGLPWMTKGLMSAKAEGIIKGVDEYSRLRLEDNPQFKEGLKIKMLFDKNIDILRKMHKSEELSEEDLLCVKHIGHGENRVKKRNKEEGEEGIGKKETSDDNKDECASAKGNQEDTEDKESTEIKEGDLTKTTSRTGNESGNRDRGHKNKEVYADNDYFHDTDEEICPAYSLQDNQRKDLEDLDWEMMLSGSKLEGIELGNHTGLESYYEKIPANSAFLTSDQKDTRQIGDNKELDSKECTNEGLNNTYAEHNTINVGSELIDFESKLIGEECKSTGDKMGTSRLGKYDQHPTRRLDQVLALEYMPCQEEHMGLTRETWEAEVEEDDSNNGINGEIGKTRVMGNTRKDSRCRQMDTQDHMDKIVEEPLINVSAIEMTDHIEKGVVHAGRGSTWLKGKLTSLENIESVRKGKDYYVEIEINVSSDKIREIQDLTVEAFPQYADFRRKVSYPHITLIHFTLVGKQCIEEIREAISKGVTWPHSFRVKLDMLEQFEDGGIHLTLSRAYEIENLHNEINRVLVTEGICVNKIEGKYRPHLAIFHKQNGSKNIETTWGFKEHVGRDELQITQEVKTLKLMRARDYHVQHIWELTSLANRAMELHYCLMVTNEETAVKRDTINRIVMEHNVALLTLRSQKKDNVSTTKGNATEVEDKKRRDIDRKQPEECKSQEDESYKAEKVEYEFNRQAEPSCQRVRDVIYTIETDSEGDDEDKGRKDMEDGTDKNRPEHENEREAEQDNEEYENEEGEISLENTAKNESGEKNMIEEHKEADLNNEDINDVEDIRWERTMTDHLSDITKEAGVNIMTDKRKGESQKESEETTASDHQWNKETIKQIRDTRLLYNPLRYTFRKGIRIGSIVIAFIYKSLSKFPSKQKQLLDNVKYTTNVVLIQNVVSEKEWREDTKTKREEQRKLREILEDIRLIRINGWQPKTRTMGDKRTAMSHKEQPNYTRELEEDVEEFEEKLNDLDKHMTKEMGPEDINRDRSRLIGIANKDKNTIDTKGNLWKDVVLLGEGISKGVKVRLEEIVENEIELDVKTNPMKLLSLDPTINDKGWTRYPGLKNMTTIMRNLARKLMTTKDSGRSFDKQTCEKIVMKMKHWRRYGESLCGTAGLGRAQVKTIGRIILKDYNKFLSLLENMTELKINCEEVAKEIGFKWGHIDSREIKKNTEILRRIPDNKSYWDTIDTIGLSKTFMLTTMGCMTKQTQKYMQNNWSKKKIHQHVCIRDEVMMSNFRWKETQGTRERFQNMDENVRYQRNFEGGALGNVPLLDKWSPWFLCIALHIHHSYRILTRGVRGIDVKHHGLTQNNLDLMQFIYAPGSIGIFKKIRGMCFNCRKRLKHSISNAYGSIHDSQLTASYPFSKVNMDLAGPFFVKGNVSERSGTRGNPSRIKTWIMVLVCSFSKASSLEIVETCEVASLADALGRHMCKYGPIQFAVSDRAPNQMKLLKDSNWRELVRGEIFTRYGISYELVPVSCHSFNGLAENKIKQMKLILGNCNFKMSNITITQLNSIIQLVANIMNSVPLGCSLKNTSDTGLQVITPAHFLIPRRNLYRILISPISVKGTNQEYFYEMDTIYENLMTYYEDTVIPAMLHRPHHYQKNGIEDFEVEDIVLFRKKPANNFSKHWSLGKIIEVFIDRDGSKKSVMIKYINLDGDESEETVTRSTQGKALKLRNNTYRFIQHESHRMSSEIIKLYPLEDDVSFEHVREMQGMSMGHGDNKENHESTSLICGMGKMNEGTTEAQEKQCCCCTSHHRLWDYLDGGQ